MAWLPCPALHAAVVGPPDMVGACTTTMSMCTCDTHTHIIWLGKLDSGRRWFRIGWNRLSNVTLQVYCTRYYGHGTIGVAVIIQPTCQFNRGCRVARHDMRIWWHGNTRWWFYIDICVGPTCHVHRMWSLCQISWQCHAACCHNVCFR